MILTTRPLVGTEGITLNDFVDGSGTFDRLAYDEYLDLGGEPLMDDDDLRFARELLASEEIDGTVTRVIGHLSR